MVAKFPTAIRLGAYLVGRLKAVARWFFRPPIASDGLACGALGAICLLAAYMEGTCGVIPFSEGDFAIQGALTVAIGVLLGGLLVVRLLGSRVPGWVALAGIATAYFAAVPLTAANQVPYSIDGYASSISVTELPEKRLQVEQWKDMLITMERVDAAPTLQLPRAGTAYETVANRLEFLSVRDRVLAESMWKQFGPQIKHRLRSSMGGTESELRELKSVPYWHRVWFFAGPMALQFLILGGLIASALSVGAILRLFDKLRK